MLTLKIFKRGFEPHRSPDRRSRYEEGSENVLFSNVSALSPGSSQRAQRFTILRAKELRACLKRKRIGRGWPKVVLLPQESPLLVHCPLGLLLMVPIRAILHAHNDALRIGRCMETLYPCDEIVVVDHGSADGTLHVAREYGARIVKAAAEDLATADLWSAGMGRQEWILCLDPSESLSESLAASLFEWKSEAVPEGASGYSVFLREETAGGWVENPVAQTRLVPASWQKWAGRFPQTEDSAVVLEGELLRFVLP